MGSSGVALELDFWPETALLSRCEISNYLDSRLSEIQAVYFNNSFSGCRQDIFFCSVMRESSGV